MAKCDKSFDGLSDLLIREQFLSRCAPEMALFLNERVPESVHEMLRLAEQYMDAHSGAVHGSSQWNSHREDHKNREWNTE